MKSLMAKINIIIAALGVVSLIMIFLPAVKFSVYGQSETYKGLSVAFGNKEEGFKFSILNCLTWVAVIGVIACGVLAHVKGNKTMTIAAVACAVVAALLFFLTNKFIQLDAPSALVKEYKKYFDLGIGSILGGICSILAAVAGVCKIVLDK